MIYRQPTAEEKRRKCKYYRKHTGSCSHPAYKKLCCRNCLGFKNKYEE